MNRIVRTFSATLVGGRPATFSSALALLFLLTLFTGCTETPTQPQVGSGDELSATVDGEVIEFDIEESTTEYNQTQLFGQFSGSSSDLPVKSITLSFRGFDIDNGTYPAVLSGADASITLVTEDEGGNTLAYRTPVTGSDTKITLTAKDDDIIDGTFSGTLVDPFDNSSTISVTGGAFSVKIR